MSKAKAEKKPVKMDIEEEEAEQQDSILEEDFLKHFAPQNSKPCSDAAVLTQGHLEGGCHLWLFEAPVDFNVDWIHKSKLRIPNKLPEGTDSLEVGQIEVAVQPPAEGSEVPAETRNYSVVLKRDMQSMQYTNFLPDDESGVLKAGTPFVHLLSIREILELPQPVYPQPPPPKALPSKLRGKYLPSGHALAAAEPKLRKRPENQSGASDSRKKSKTSSAVESAQ